MRNQYLLTFPKITKSREGFFFYNTISKTWPTTHTNSKINSSSVISKIAKQKGEQICSNMFFGKMAKTNIKITNTNIRICKHFPTWPKISRTFLLTLFSKKSPTTHTNFWKSVFANMFKNNQKIWESVSSDIIFQTMIKNTWEF